MLDSDENNGGSPDDGANSNAADAPKAIRTKKRVLTSDLSARIAALEARIEAIGATLSKNQSPSPLEGKITQLADQIAKLDERVSKIAHVVAQSNLINSRLS
jgi:uncharacterized protein YceH (UPF0502 family)